MTALLFISYSSTLSEEEKVVIDKIVFQNRVALKKCIKKIYHRIKVIGISSAAGLVIFISTIEPANPMGLTPLVPARIMKHNNPVSSVKVASSNVIPQNKSYFIKIPQIDKTFIEPTENENIELLVNTLFEVPVTLFEVPVETLLSLRGGNDYLSPLGEVLFRFLIILVAELQRSKGAEGFQPRQINPGFAGQGRQAPAPRIAPKIQKNPINQNNPAEWQNPGQGTCKTNTNNQDQTITKEQRRNLPSPDDVIIPEQNVIIRHGQAKYKLKKHGHDFDIESTLNENGHYRSKVTPENIDTFKKKIKDLVLNGKRIEGSYRKDQTGECAAIHFYDSKTKRNAIFKQETKEFISAWELTKGQRDDLKNNKNVGGY